jgi:hypothetical protein
MFLTGCFILYNLTLLKRLCHKIFRLDFFTRSFSAGVPLLLPEAFSNKDSNSPTVNIRIPSLVDSVAIPSSPASSVLSHSPKRREVLEYTPSQSHSGRKVGKTLSLPHVYIVNC